MARLLVYYAHPGHRTSRANKALSETAQSIEGVTFVDLYRECPRHIIQVDREQQRLIDHDVILFQFPMFWYSTPSIIKEWQDLVLEHGFAYGSGGVALTGKTMMLAVTAAGSSEAYTPQGYQHYPIRNFLVPLEQTARLCHMKFAAPYVLYSSLKAPDTDELETHRAGYQALLTAILEDRYDFEAACAMDVVEASTLPLKT